MFTYRTAPFGGDITLLSCTNWYVYVSCYCGIVAAVVSHRCVRRRAARRPRPASLHVTDFLSRVSQVHESSKAPSETVRVAQKALAIEKSERNSERVAIFTLLIAAAASIHHHDHDTTCSSKRVPIGITGSVTNLEVGRNHSTSETVADRR